MANRPNTLTTFLRIASEPQIQVINKNGKESKVVRLLGVNSKSKKDKQTGKWVNDENAVWVNIEIWANSDRTSLFDIVCDQVTKGTEIYVSGELTVEKWTDKNTGAERSRNKLERPVNFQVISGRKQQDMQDASAASVESESGGESGESDDIPF
jgi:single-stranded DNA-binding protein